MSHRHCVLCLIYCDHFRLYHQCNCFLPFDTSKMRVFMVGSVVASTCQQCSRNLSTVSLSVMTALHADRSHKIPQHFRNRRLAKIYFLLHFFAINVPANVTEIPIYHVELSIGITWYNHNRNKTTWKFSPTHILPSFTKVHACVGGSQFSCSCGIIRVKLHDKPSTAWRDSLRYFKQFFFRLQVKSTNTRYSPPWQPAALIFWGRSASWGGLFP